MLAGLLRHMGRPGEQIDQIISILKISDERQTRAEERQDALLTEIKRGFAEADRRFDEHNERIKDQGQHFDTMLNTQMQMRKLMNRQATRTEELTECLPSWRTKAVCAASKIPYSTKPAKLIPSDFFHL